jgi:hypothetical protein
MRNERLTTFTCRICRKSVSLQECITDDAMGEPVHPDCYAEWMKQEANKGPRPHNEKNSV